MKIQAWIPVILCACVAACGGGGGSSGGGSSSGGGRHSISAIPKSLDFNSPEFEGLPPRQTISVTFSGAGVVVGYPPGQAAPPWLQVTAPSTASSPVNVAFDVTPNVPHGQYTAIVRLVTGDADGTDLVWTDVTVRYRADQRFGAEASEPLDFLEIDGNPAGVMPSAGLDVDITGTNVSWSATPSEPWISVTPASGTNAGTVVVRVNRQGLAKGTHQGEIAFTDAANGFAYRIPVNYVIRDTQLVPSSTSVTWPVTPTTSAAALAATLQLTDELGGAVPGYNLRWTASVESPWLELSHYDGNTGAPTAIGLSAITEELEDARPGPNVANIEFTYVNDHGASGTLTVPVTIDMRLPLARAVTPYRVDPGAPRTVILRGEDMDADDVSRLRLDGAAVDATRVDYTTWEVDLPALSAGEHQLSFTNALGLSRSHARFRAAGSIAPPPGWIDLTGAKSRVLYDEQRGRIYVLNRTAEAVQRFAWDGAAWAALSEIPVAQAQDIDFDRTGGQLYVIADQAIYKVDLDAAMPVATPWLPRAGRELRLTSSDLGYFGVLDSGVALLAQQFFGSGHSQTLVVDLLRGDQPSMFGSPLSVANAYEGRINVSPDGRYAAIGECCLSPGADLQLIDGRAGDSRDLGYQRYPIDTFRSNYRYMGFDAANQLLMGDGRLFDISAPEIDPASGTAPLLGVVPSNYSYALLSPDGSRLYALVVFGDTANRLEVYDTRSQVDGEFVKLGETTLTTNVAEETDDLHHYPGEAHKFAGVITASGSHLILSGTRGILVLGTPAP